MESKLQCFSLFKLSEQIDIVNLIASANEVDIDGLEERLGLAETVGVIYDNETIASTASIKKPHANYVAKILTKSSNEKFSGVDFLELGYICTDISNRGKGFAPQLITLLLEKHSSDHLYATTRVDNFSMIAILERYGFFPQGNSYPSINGLSELRIYFKTDQL